MKSSQYQSVLSEAHFGFAFHEIITDGSGKPNDYRFIEVNEQYEKLTGLKATNITGTTASEVFRGIENSELDRISFYGKIADGGAGENFEYYSKQLHRWYNVQVFSPEKGFFSTVYVAAKESFNESELQFKSLFQNAADAIFIADKDTGLIVDANQVASRLMQMPLKNIIGLHQKQLHPPEPENCKKDLFKLHTRELKENSQSLPVEDMVLRPDGVEVPVEILASEVVYKGKVCLMGTFRDMSRRKHDEHFLDQTKLTYENIVNSLTEAIYILDENGLFIEVNKGATKMYGYSREELIGQSPQTVAAPGMNDLDSIVRKTAQVTKTGNPARFEFWAIRKNGETFPKDVILNKGNYFGKDVVIAVARDITEIKKTEKTLIESKLKFQNLIELAVDGILIGSIDGNIIQSNSRFCTMTGISSNELAGRHISTLPFAPEAMLNNPFRFDLLQKGEIVISERRLAVPGGNIIDIEMRSKMMPDNTYQSIVIDITERKKLENIQKLILEISHLSVKYNSLNGFLAEIHQKINKIIRADNFYVALYNPHNDTYSFSYHVDEYDNIELDTPYDLSAGFTENVRKNGKALLIRGNMYKGTSTDKQLKGIGDVPSVWLGLPLSIGSHDEVIGVLVVQDYHNFEAYNEVEQATLEIIANNIGVFIERVKNFEELKNAKEKAEQSDRLKSAFLMNMSHEIRTPMNGILGFIDLLENQEVDDASRKNYFGLVNMSGQRLLSTINDIIEISRIEAGELNLRVDEINVEDVMRFQYDFFRPQAIEKNLRFELSETLKGVTAFVQTDRHKLEGVLINLIKNAIKFTTHGLVELGSKIENGFIVFWVSDTGRGIPAARLEAIFDQFVQADVSITRAHEGSGLGLAIVKAYVNALGGTISVQSTIGKGSTFRFSIPYIVSKNRSVPDFEASIDKDISLKGIKILVAEDDDISFHFLRIILTRMGFSLIRTINGKDAVEALRENPAISLILMDIKMPGIDGLMATKLIRQFNHTIPIIAQTAHAFVGEKEKALEAGCNDYISKPINIDKLMVLMKKYIEK